MHKTHQRDKTKVLPGGVGHPACPFLRELHYQSRPRAPELKLDLTAQQLFLEVPSSWPHAANHSDGQRLLLETLQPFPLGMESLLDGHYLLQLQAQKDNTAGQSTGQHTNHPTYSVAFFRLGCQGLNFNT